MKQPHDRRRRRRRGNSDLLRVMCMGCFLLPPGSSGQPLTLRVRHSLEAGARIPWQLRYIGQPELSQKATIVRSCYDIACSNNVVEFLTELGCRLDYEFISKGSIFRKGRIKVTVSKVYKAGLGGGPDNLEPQTGSHLVELSVLAPSGNDAVGEDMKNFADQLKPLVMLDKFDLHRRQM